MKESTRARRQMVLAVIFVILIFTKAPEWISLVLLGISVLYYVLTIINEHVLP